MWTRIRLWYYRRKARRLLNHLYLMEDTYGCGNALRRHISPLYNEFDEVWSKIKDLDPKAPSNPYKPKL